MRQTCVIFDLDNTLIHTTSSKKDKYDIMIRPFTHKLLNFLYKNQKRYCIGFWSSGVDSYVNNVINTLMKPYKNWSVLLKLARYNKIIDHRYSFIDLDSHKIYNYPHNKIVKPIKFLLKHDDFKQRFYRKKVILIDDLEDNIQANVKRHTYKIKEWTCDMHNDKELLILYKKLKRKDKTRKR